MDKRQEFTWDDVITIASQAGALAAIKEWEQRVEEKDRSFRDKRYHNTKLLLKHYRSLKAHIENARYSDEQLAQDADDMLELMDAAKNEEVYINSIKRTRKRTEIIISHIDVMLSFYAAQGKDDPQKYLRCSVIEGLYLLGKNVQKLAKDLTISERYVYKLERQGIDDLSILLFGIDGLKIER
jgi:hypothetical protein